MRRRKPQDLNWLDLTYMCALWEVARKLLHGVDTNVDSFVSNFCHHIRVLHQRVIGHLKKSLPVLGHLHFVSKLLFFSSFFPFAESQFCFLFSLSLSLFSSLVFRKSSFDSNGLCSRHALTRFGLFPVVLSFTPNGHLGVFLLLAVVAVDVDVDVDVENKTPKHTHTPTHKPIGLLSTRIRTTNRSQNPRKCGTLESWEWNA